MKDFDSIEMVPVPHRNTLNFLGMRPKNSYLIWRETNGIFTAMANRDGQKEIDAFVIATGKKVKARITVEPMVLADY
jgi:hypothetical protein